MNPRISLSLSSLLLSVSLVAADPAGLYNAGRAAFRANDLEKAEAQFAAAVQAQPNNADYHYWLGLTLGRQAQQASVFKQASLAGKTRNEFERAVQLDPNHLEARSALISYYKMAPGFMGGSDEKALEQAKEIRKRDAMEGADAFATIYIFDKKLDLARKEYVDLVRANPNSAEAHFKLGSFLQGFDKKYSGGMQELETSLRLDPNYMRAYVGIARVAALSNSNLPRGIEAAKKYIAYTPKDDEPPVARAHYWLGMIYEKQGKRAEAKQEYVTSLRLQPKNKEVEAALKRVG